MDRKIDYKKLLKLRLDKRMTQKQVADKLNITRSAYSRIERGERGIRFEQGELIAEALGVSIVELRIEGSDERLQHKDSNSEMRWNLEIELMELLYRQYETDYPDQPWPFSEYITCNSIGPEMAFESLKRDILEYRTNGIYPFYVDDGNVDEGIDWIDRIQPLLEANDEAILSFVMNKNNYEFVWTYALGAPYYYPEDTQYSAFKRMIAHTPFISTLFGSGFFKKSRLNTLWERFLNDHPKWNKRAFPTII